MILPVFYYLQFPSIKKKRHLISIEKIHSIKNIYGSYDVLSRDNYRLPRFCIIHYQV